MYLASAESDKIDQLMELHHYHPIDITVGVPPLTLRVPLTTGKRVVVAGALVLGFIGFGGLLISKMLRNSKR